MIRRKKLATLGALAASAALVLSACSSGNGGTGGGDGNGANGDDNREEIVYVDAVGTNPPHLNIQLSTDVTTRLIGTSIFDSLVNLGEGFELLPSLATEWSANEDATQFTFTLRDGVEWHDGEPFTSHDVKFNMDEVMPLHPLGATLARAHESIEAPDDSTVVVNLAYPFAAYIEGMAGQRMIPAHLYEGTDIATNPVNSEPVGTGPFKFSEFVEGSHIHVVKNENYWGEVTNVDRVIFQIMPDANARILAYRSGDVDRISSGFLEAAQAQELRNDPNNYFTRGNSVPGTQTLFFNTRGDGPTSDPAVRAALYRAMDRQAIADNVYYGMAKPARGPIPAAIEWAANPDMNYAEQFAFDPEQAAAELDAAGYPADANGHRFELTLRVASALPTFVGTSEVVKSNLEEIGVSVNLLAEDLNVFVDQVYTQHNFDMAVMSFGSFEDPSLGVSRLYVCNPDSLAFQNPTGICDDEVDEAFQAAASVADREQRAIHFAEMERRVAELLHTVPLIEDESESMHSLEGWEGIEEFANIVYYDWSALRAAE